MEDNKIVKLIRLSPIYTSRRFNSLKRVMQLAGQLYALFNTFRSYSQTGEDAILRLWLPEKKGTYVDIGSGKPVADSNSFFLYRRGWKGICVDPIGENYHLHRILRPRDTHMQILIGKSNLLTDFWEFSSYAFSTANHEVASELIKSGKTRLIRKSKIQEMPLSGIVPKVDPIEPSLLTVDVEGYEINVLDSNNWERFKPRIICVEEWDFHPSITSNISVYLS